jgi:hypothetical protein
MGVIPQNLPVNITRHFSRHSNSLLKALTLKEQRPSSQMAKSRKWPKLACSLGEQILRLAKLANTRIFGLHSEPIRSQKEHYKYHNFSQKRGRTKNGRERQTPTDSKPREFRATLKETLKETHLHQGYLRPTQSGANPKSDLPIQGCNSIANRFALLLPLYVLNLHVIS